MIANGEIGVDTFFTLSGFLIGYILFREIDKYGAVDALNFYRSRFLRIWPAMAFYILMFGWAQMRSKPTTIISNLFFVGNIFDMWDPVET